MSSGKMAELLKTHKLGGVSPSVFTRHYLDTAYPPLNEVISGDLELGLPSGQLVMIAGPSACGKTMISTQMMISAQKQGGFAAFFDYETQYQIKLAKKQGLDDDPEKFQYYLPETFEEGIRDAINLAQMIRDNDAIPKDAPIVFVFDSLYMMTPASKLASIKEALAKGTKLSMHDNYALSAACSAWFPSISRDFNRLGVTAIFLNQVRRKLDMYGNEIYTFPGGDEPYYACSTVLVLTAKDVSEGVGLAKRLVKKEVTVLTKKSRNTMPMQKIRYDFVFKKDGTGDFDVIGSYADHLQEKGIIPSAGPRVEWKGGKPFMKQVKEELYADPVKGLQALKDLHKASVPAT